MGTFDCASLRNNNNNNNNNNKSLFIRQKYLSDVTIKMCYNKKGILKFLKF